ncbi:twin-arginine translocase TatA/TatE family subunit [Carboxydothermus hydrogenoformans]|uniref:Sec-independent protein translocase protein TatA n=1 Tax=Carboxydothermus hydrogenoformans (strain ATCC BAA-161 / DSM 6008 / Z-2901) TaxID=246194 RepID=Q3ADR3_CARHZ|nr:twin-arginine translocase TatA/TatE family subunit [Carboxydothermus hydrogenoformans]ABB16097.1 twin-arginine translocation protein, TatA/E family [Carboxydothermus hydrogenoformans Z-2901]
MFGNFGWQELLIVLVIALIIFGPSKLPELGKAFGQTVKEFRKGAKEIQDEIALEEAKEEKQA